jgi:glutamate dehydrogenase (NAD(P)+)
MAVADQDKCLISENPAGLPVSELLRTPGPRLPEPDRQSRIRVAARTEIFNCPADLLIPAAVENSITPEIAARLTVRAVVPGANLAVTGESEALLHEKGVLVLPDFLVGCGGSLSMEGLYGPADHPTPRQVLDHVRVRMQLLVDQVVARSRREHCLPRAAALAICAERPPREGQRPYQL